MQILDIMLEVAVSRREMKPRSINSAHNFSTAASKGFLSVFFSQLHNRCMDRSTSSETTTNTVNTVATDHVGVNANDRSSIEFSGVSDDLDSDIFTNDSYHKLHTLN
nr:hypothetical protein Iba_chr03bCG12480 [Ipomoea batatas]